MSCWLRYIRARYCVQSNVVAPPHPQVRALILPTGGADDMLDVGVLEHERDGRSSRV